MQISAYVSSPLPIISMTCYIHHIDIPASRFRQLKLEPPSLLLFISSYEFLESLIALCNALDTLLFIHFCVPNSNG